MFPYLAPLRPRIFPWQRLKAISPIPKDVPLMELNGQIGFQSIYCADSENRYEEFSSPLPFVLFHPQLPIYIDTRREGSPARYVRRRCRPNATLETYLSDGREYHFGLSATGRSPLGSRLLYNGTSGSLEIRRLGCSESLGCRTRKRTHSRNRMSMSQSTSRSTRGCAASRLEYGGCACDLGNECAFARFHRKNYARFQSRPAAAPKKKARKPKTQHTISPTSTGHATNSRAASEVALKMFRKMTEDPSLVLLAASLRVET